MISMLDKHRLSMVPPEGVPLQFELARIGDRMSALTMDILFVFLGMLGLSLLALLALLVGLIGSAFTFSLIGSLVIVGLFIIRQGYFFFFELKWQGSTPGKRFSNIRVISRDGGSLTLAALIARNLFRDLELFIPIGILLAPGQLDKMPAWVTYSIIGWLAIMVALPFVNKQHLRLGDMVAGTMVIRIPVATLQDDKAALTNERSAYQALTFTNKQLSIYGEFELETLSDLLHKADQGRADRKTLAKVASTIAAKIDYDGPEPQEEALRFLRTFYAQQRKQLESHLLMGQRKASKHD